MYKIIIAGGGAGSVAVASHLARAARVSPEQILIVEPAPLHYYQPGFALVGGGVYGSPSDVLSKHIDFLQQRTQNMFNPKLHFLPKAVKAFSPEENLVEIVDGSRYTYENLIVALGVLPDFTAVDGLVEALNDPNSNVCSVYNWNYALKTNKIIKNFNGKSAVFCTPEGAIKHPEAPLSLMHLAHENFQRSGLKNTQLHHFAAGTRLFPMQKYEASLRTLGESKGFQVHLEHSLTQVDYRNNIVYLKQNSQEIAVEFDMLHVVPPNRPQEAMRDSSLADAQGYLRVDRQTLRHREFNNVWGLGDCIAGEEKTLGSVLVQANVLAYNLLQTINGEEPKAIFKGFSSSSVCVGSKKVVVCSHEGVTEGDQHLFEVVPKPSYWKFITSKWFHPRAYFWLVKRGWWSGNSLFKLKFN